jgi:hypothetical protein
MTHIEDKHAEEEHQGVIAAIRYLKFWVSYNCQTIEKQNINNKTQVPLPFSRVKTM